MTENPQVYNSELDAFDLYHKLQEEPAKPVSYLDGPALPSLGHAIAGAVGASVSNICVYPLAVVVTRLQIQRKKPEKRESAATNARLASMADAVRRLYEDGGGISAFYAGLWSDTGKTIADAFLFFLAYDLLRRSRLKSKEGGKRRLSVLDELGVGFMAGAASKLCTMPLANVVTRQQAGTSTARSLRSVASEIQNQKGIQGFWSGYSASLILTLNPSLTFFFFESLKWSLLPRIRRASPSPKETFCLAALSKALASSITYPFSLAKSRLQSRSSGQDHVDAGSSKGQKSDARVGVKRRHANVISVLLEIINDEGIGGIYEGLDGEVLKGFFSHGITMLVKGLAHVIVVRLFYSILRVLKKYPDPKQLAEIANLRADRAASNLGRQAQRVVKEVRPLK